MEQVPASRGNSTRAQSTASAPIRVSSGLRTRRGKWLVDESLPLATRAAAFKLVADALHSKDFPAPFAIGHRMVSGGPTVQTNQPTSFAWTPGFIATCPK